MMTVLAEKPKALAIPISPPLVDMEDPEPYTSEEFARLTQTYPDLRMEMTKQGQVIVMPPAGGETGGRNSDLNADLVIWNRAVKKGKVFDSSTGFILPNGAERSPNVSWVEASRWDALTAAQKSEFVPLCPDFVIELRSKTDRLSPLQKKMQEYIENGTRLGWLIDPKWKRVEVYRPGQEVEVLNAPSSASADPELPGFVLNLESIWPK